MINRVLDCIQQEQLAQLFYYFTVVDIQLYRGQYLQYVNLKNDTCKELLCIVSTWC